MAEHESLWVLVAKFTVHNRLNVVNWEASFFLVAFKEKICVYVSRNKKFHFWFIKTFQSFIQNFHISIQITLYKFCVNFDASVSTATTQTFKSFSLQLWYKFCWNKNPFKQKYTHLPSVYCDNRNCTLTFHPAMWCIATRPVLSCY